MDNADTRRCNTDTRRFFKEYICENLRLICGNLRFNKVFLFFCFYVLWVSFAEGAEVSRSRLIMGTLFEIKVIDEKKTEDEINNAIEEAFKPIAQVDELMSNYKKDSEVSRFNRLKKDERLTLSKDTFEVIKRALEFSRLTHGAFDITVGSLLQVWGFYSDETTDTKSAAPDESAIKDALRFVGFANVVIDEHAGAAGVTKEGVKIDLGGIAKGYAVDKAVTALRNEGITNALIDGGGDMYALGLGPKQDGWRVGIQHPRKSNELLAVIQLKDMAVATSGDYARYPNILNPQTGMPVIDVPMSVTVVAFDATTADALATSLFVLGRKEGMALIESLKPAEAMIVSEDNNDLMVDISSGLNKFICKQANP